MKTLTKLILLFFLLLPLSTTYGSAGQTIYTGDKLAVYNIFYKSFKNDNIEELKAKSKEAMKIHDLSDSKKFKQLIVIIRQSIVDLINESPGSYVGNCPTNRLDYDIGLKTFENIRDTTMITGDVITLKFNTGDSGRLTDMSLVEFGGHIPIRTMVVSKNKCDFDIINNFYSVNINPSLVFLFDPKVAPELPHLERNTDYYINIINKNLRDEPLIDKCKSAIEERRTYANYDGIDQKCGFSFSYSRQN